MKPLNDQVVVKLDKRTEQIGLIEVPEAYRKRPMFGTIIECGPACTEVEKGNRVFFHVFSGKDVKLDEYGDGQYVIMGEDEIYGVLEEGEDAEM